MSSGDRLAALLELVRTVCPDADLRRASDADPPELVLSLGPGPGSGSFRVVLLDGSPQLRELSFGAAVSSPEAGCMVRVLEAVETFTSTQKW